MKIKKTGIIQNQVNWDNACLRAAGYCNKKARRHKAIVTLYFLTSFNHKQRVYSLWDDTRTK